MDTLRDLHRRLGRAGPVHALSSLVFLAWLAGCLPVDPPEDRAPRAEREADPARRLRGLLQARHPEDLPSREALERYDDVDALLRQIATTDEELIVRARAADLLGLRDNDGNRDFLLQLAADPAAHGKVRAAAILGLGHMDLSRRPDVVEALVGHARGGDARLGPEAAGVLARTPAAAGVVGALQADGSLTPAVKAALQAR